MPKYRPKFKQFFIFCPLLEPSILTAQTFIIHKESCQGNLLRPLSSTKKSCQGNLLRPLSSTKRAVNCQGNLLRPLSSTKMSCQGNLLRPLSSTKSGCQGNLLRPLSSTKRAVKVTCSDLYHPQRELSR